MNNQERNDFGSKECFCPKCGHRIKHAERGSPCTEKKCPRCESEMLGEPCLENGRVGSIRMMKFKCGDCGLLMALPKKPVSCIICGGSEIIRCGWKSRLEQQ
jgi:hypothetical protein